MYATNKNRNNSGIFFLVNSFLFLDNKHTLNLNIVCHTSFSTILILFKYFTYNNITVMICMRTRICGLGWIGYIPAHTHTPTHEKRVTMNAIIVLTFTKIYSIDGL